MHEPLLLGTIGQPRHKAFPSVINGVARVHSRKPDEVYAEIRLRTPGARRCDIFARETRAGFSGWGREATKFNPKKGGS